MDALGELWCEMGQEDKAKKIFLKSIELEPDSDFSKYLNLGQICEGLEAVSWIRSGITRMYAFRQRLTDSLIDPQQLEMIEKQICGGLCSIAEIYMTDSCFEENAEAECQKTLEEALTLQPEDAETLQVFANFKICQNQQQEALNFLRKSYSKWELIDIEGKPSFEFRTSSAKLFLELNEPRTSVDILEDLLLEEDEIAEIWFLLGTAYTFISKKSARQCLEKAKTLLLTLGCEDEELPKLVDNQLKEVEKSEAPEEEAEEDGDEEEENQVTFEDEIEGSMEM